MSTCEEPNVWVTRSDGKPVALYDAVFRYSAYSEPLFRLGQREPYAAVDVAPSNYFVSFRKKVGDSDGKDLNNHAFTIDGVRYSIYSSKIKGDWVEYRASGYRINSSAPTTDLKTEMFPGWEMAGINEPDFGNEWEDEW